jgi:hypothetical protein
MLVPVVFVRLCREKVVTPTGFEPIDDTANDTLILLRNFSFARCFTGRPRVAGGAVESSRNQPISGASARHTRDGTGSVQ